MKHKGILLGLVFLLLTPCALAKHKHKSKTDSTTSATATSSQMATVTINSQATITTQSGTSDICLQELAKPSTVSGSGLVYTVEAGTTLKFTKCKDISLTIQDNYATPGSKCSNSQAEINLKPGKSSYDVSLVNGFSSPVTLIGNETISVTSKDANNSATNAQKGVYPYGCSNCLSRTSADCGYSSIGKTKNCSASNNCQVTMDDTTHFSVSFD